MGNGIDFFQFIINNVIKTFSSKICKRSFQLRFIKGKQTFFSFKHVNVHLEQHCPTFSPWRAKIENHK